MLEKPWPFGTMVKPSPVSSVTNWLAFQRS
jgi:hypothetical protein